MLECSTYYKVTAHNNKRSSRNRDVCLYGGTPMSLEHLPLQLLNYYASCSCYNLTGRGEMLEVQHTELGAHNNKRSSRNH
jgi:hypothetical protein